MAAELLPAVPPTPARSRWLRLVRRAAGLLAVLVILIGLSTGLALRASLAVVDGERRLPGLGGPVTVTRDAMGVPTIEGATREDVARATGFVHAQERFFQMDLLRRRAAGEIAELVGAGALPLDRAVRLHGFRKVARDAVALEQPDGRRLLEAYAAGANAGLEALGARPPEYLVLGARPAPWKPEDTLLAGLAMFLELHDEQGVRDSSEGVMADLLPPALVAFLSPPGTEWDAPLRGEPMPAVHVPPPDVLDLRAAPALPRVAQAAAFELDEIRPGSNNWVVSGAHTADGRPLVADDMHLGMAVPNTWYRAVLTWGSGDARRRLVGVTLPGTPALVAGSTGRVAWGFTNSEGDWVDLVVLEADPADPERYRTPNGWATLGRRIERIGVKGAADDVLEVRTTIWGPVVDRDHRGRRRALRWTAHAPEAVNMRLLPMEEARDLREAFDIAHGSGGPPQNFVAADTAGHIGWTIIGRIPRRVGFDGRRPESWADGTRRWDGWVEPGAYPEILDPPGGRLWTANGRTVDGDWLALLGHGTYEHGARPRQIRDGLLAIAKASPRDLLNVQLDDRALFLQRWQELLLATLAGPQAGRRAEMRKLVEGWGGRAAADSVGYRLVRRFRRAVAEEVLPPLAAACRQADDRFGWPRGFPQAEGPLWALVSERPAHLLPPGHASWDALLLAAVDRTLDALPEGPLAARTWGEENTLAGRHPLSRAVPALSRWLDLPARPLPGSTHMPRVQTPGEGASERFVVSPGQEEQGLFHMPGGQSGHVLSPWFRAGHAAWEAGEPTPLLPGPAAHALRLVP